MLIVVQKFGGTSVGSVEKIRHVARIVKAAWSTEQKVVVVLSAMSGVTDHLLNTANEISQIKSDAALQEYDTILASGEQVSAGLLALALQSLGLKARSYLGWQIPITTDSSYSKGRITSVNVEPLLLSLKNDEIPIVAGFQGVYNNRIVTLGRGGSDTTAAAVAAALSAYRCDIYTDVTGVFTSDPRIVEKAKKLHKITYEEMLEMALTGAKVLHPRAVEIAMHYKLHMQVLSTFEDTPGTLLINEEDAMEKQLVTGITGRSDIARLTIFEISDTNIFIQKLCELFTEYSIAIEMLLQNVAAESQASDITIVFLKSDILKVQKILSSEVNFTQHNYHIDNEVAKVAIIGLGMKNHPDVLQKMFQILSEKGIKVLAITTSEIKITILILAAYKELAMRSLHTAFELDCE